MNKLTKRLVSAYIDLLVMYGVIYVVVFVIQKMYGDDITQKYFYWFALGATLLCSFKDITGYSVGHSVLKLKLVDVSTGKKPSLWRRILRDVSLFLWPIELITIVIRKDRRRLLDVLFQTDVVCVEEKQVYEPKEISIDLKKTQKMIVWCIVLAALAFFPLVFVAAIIIGVVATKTANKYLLYLYNDEDAITKKVQRLKAVGSLALVSGVVYACLYVLVAIVCIK